MADYRPVVVSRYKWGGWTARVRVGDDQVHLDGYQRLDVLGRRVVRVLRAARMVPTAGDARAVWDAAVARYFDTERRGRAARSALSGNLQPWYSKARVPVWGEDED